MKVALLKSTTGFDLLEKSAVHIRMRKESAWAPAVRLSAELHLNHITQGGDPFESRQARPLDYGHWSAHRLEGMTNFTVPHREAVR